VDIDRVLEVAAKLFGFFLCEGVSCNDYVYEHFAWITAEEVSPSNACSTFIASFADVSKYGIPPFDWQNVMARFCEIYDGVS
jgi:hypothetical protein